MKPTMADLNYTFQIETKLKILLEVLRAKYILVDIENIQTLFWDDQIIFAESRIILLIHLGDAARPLIHNKWVILPQSLHLQIPSRARKMVITPIKIYLLKIQLGKTLENKNRKFCFSIETETLLQWRSSSHHLPRLRLICESSQWRFC